MDKTRLRDFPLAIFGCGAATSAQALLFRGLVKSPAMTEFHIPISLSEFFWVIAAIISTFFAIVHFYRAWQFPALFQIEYYHPIKSNVYFMVILIGSLLINSTPDFMRTNVGYTFAWCCLVLSYLLLLSHRLKIWLFEPPTVCVRSGNPAYFLTTINGMLLGTAATGPELKATFGDSADSLALFLLTIGLFLYSVLFISFFPCFVQALFEKKLGFPEEGKPMLFFMIAPFAAASITIFNLFGSFNVCAQVLYFIATLVLLPLLVSIPRYVSLSYSLFWWAIVFPLASYALAGMDYAAKNEEVFPKVGYVFLRYYAFVCAIASFLIFVVNWFGTIRMFVRESHGPSLLPLLSEKKEKDSSFQQMKIDLDLQNGEVVLWARNEIMVDDPELSTIDLL